MIRSVPSVPLRRVRASLVLLVLLSSLLLSAGSAQAPQAEGLVVRASPHSVEETQARLEAALAEAGLVLAATVAHDENAASAGLELRPTRLLIFGNPQAGTPLMQIAPSIGIDLPQKMLVWEAEDGQVYLAYNDPAYLAARHGLTGMDEALERIADALAGLAEAATAP